MSDINFEKDQEEVLDKTENTIYWNGINKKENIILLKLTYMKKEK